MCSTIVYGITDPTKKMTTITLNGVSYQEGSKCPACSSERDTGGRLVLHKRKHFYLTCKKCRYTVRTEKAINQQISYLHRLADKKVGIVVSERKRKKRAKKKKMQPIPY